MGHVAVPQKTRLRERVMAPKKDEGVKHLMGAVRSQLRDGIEACKYMYYVTSMTYDDVCVTQTLRSAARLLTRRYEEALRPTGLTASQYTILHALKKAGPLGPSDLGQALAFEQTTATRLLAKMDSQGLIEFIAHKDDARRRLARLTDLGEQTYSKAYPLWKHAQKETLERISGDAWHVTRDALKKISRG